jgi:dTDP-L-rhamnose 4-epimerase
VYDIAKACRLALEVAGACGKVLNIGSGVGMEVRTVAEQMAKVLGKRIAPEIVGKYRIGDIRHCFPDISLARDVLGYTPTVNFADGVLDFAAWLDGQVAHDRVAEASAQLTERGLVV